MTAAAAASPIADREFARVQGIVHREAGIWLAPVKRALVVGRLARRLRQLGVGWRAYLDRVEADAGELVQLLDCISTNETHFFREPAHFAFLERDVFPAWAAAGRAGARPRRVRAWSAGCSTGEEPYSVAMTMLRHFPPEDGWTVEILATDLSTRALERAAAATWPIAKADEIPHADLRRWMLRGYGSQEGLMRAGPEIREVVTFARLNLAAVRYDVGTFDLVLCRNVLIYFDRETKASVVRRLLGHVAADGLLFVGHAESLSGMGVAAEAVLPTVYRPAPAAAMRARTP